jgi:Asp-tRNA(Asn)/Glu-tRNA(Gln) amidotransferase C subunit
MSGSGRARGRPPAARNANAQQHLPVPIPPVAAVAANPVAPDIAAVNAAVVPNPVLPPLTPLELGFIRIGFTDASARSLCSPDGENVTLSSLAYMDENVIKILCQTMRKPGGGEVGTIVPARAEMALQVTCYMSRHYLRTSRTLLPEHLTMVNIGAFTRQRQAEEGYKEPTERLKLSKPDKIIDFIEEWPEHVAKYNGQNGCPLSYVIRKDIPVADENADPPFGSPGTKYGSIRDEIQARAPHGTQEYHIDNAAVFDMLDEAISDHKNVKTWVKAYARTKDGRAAWDSFKQHFRGTNQMEAIEARAEKQLTTLIYSGEKPRYNFEIHVSKHLRAHLDIEKAGSEIRERSKVRKLIDSIKANHLNAAIAHVRGSDHLQDSFDRTVSYIRTFIVNNEATDTRNVSSVQDNSKGKRTRNDKDESKRSKKKIKTKHEGKADGDRFYKPKEWWALSKEERNRIIKLREQRKVSAAATNDDDKSDSDKEEKISSTSTSQRH